MELGLWGSLMDVLVSGIAAYMPHLSLLYADITEEEKQRAKEKAEALDESISNLGFTISRISLHKTDTADRTLKSWEKVAEFDLV